MKAINGLFAALLFVPAILAPSIADAVPLETALQMCNTFADNNPAQDRQTFIAHCMANMTVDSPTPKWAAPLVGAGDSFNAFSALLLIIVVGAVVYFVPTFVAYSNKRPNRAAIFVLNIFLGWTFVGWVIALVWAMMRSPEQTSAGT